MSIFTAKAWADSPATTTPLSAAALNDLEARILAAVTAAQKGGSVVALGNQASTVVCDLSQGTVFTATLTGNAVVSFVNWPAGLEVEPVLYLTQDGTGSRTVTWTGVTWQPGGVAPTLQTAAGATDIIGLSSPDAGAHVYGQTGIVIGTSAGTVMAGNDSRVVGAASAASVAAIRLVWTQVKTAAYSAVAQDAVLCDTTTGTFAVGLPAGAASGSQVRVKWRAGSAAPTVTATGLDTTWTGFSTLGDSADFSFDGTTWNLI